MTNQLQSAKIMKEQIHQNSWANAYLHLLFIHLLQVVTATFGNTQKYAAFLSENVNHFRQISYIGFKPLNSTIPGTEILYLTAPNHGNLSKR